MLVGTKHGLLECRSVRRKPPGEQWSPRETVEARGTKWNSDVDMDSGIPVPQVTSRPDEEMPTATARGKIPTVPPPAPPPEEHVPEIRGQGVHAKALRIRGLDARHVRLPVPGSHTLVNARRIKMPGTRAAEQHQQRRRNAEDNFRRGPATSHQLDPVDDENVSKKARVAGNVLHIRGEDSVKFDANEEAWPNADLVVHSSYEGALIDGLSADKVKAGDAREIKQMKDLQLYSWVK